jgi:thioredoxin-like negative regulator of GroEL
MIEILLQAERALSAGLVDQAERLYRQAVDADPRNSIAVVGLARVALERGDEAGAWRHARRALEIDPENVAALRLAGRLEEVWAARGAPPPEAAASPVAEPEAPGPAAAEPQAPEAATAGPAADDPPAPDPVAPGLVAAGPQPATAPPQARSALDRLLRRNRP